MTHNLQPNPEFMRQVPLEFRSKWGEALRSGEYKQGRLRMHTKHNNTYCCLGVACDILGEKDLSGANPSAFYQPLFADMFRETLRPWNPDIAVGSRGDGISAVECNDDRELTFLEIADLINPEACSSSRSK